MIAAREATSRNPTLLPLDARTMARFAATELFPTPPFPGQRKSTVFGPGSPHSRDEYVRSLSALCDVCASLTHAADIPVASKIEPTSDCAVRVSLMATSRSCQGIEQCPKTRACQLASVTPTNALRKLPFLAWVLSTHARNDNQGGRRKTPCLCCQSDDSSRIDRDALGRFGGAADIGEKPNS